MSYTPTEWESTDVVTATRINALEQAVGDMNMSYTPNVWSDGDILSAEKMNALEQAVASGGGGSSDFSTAQVTLVNGTSSNRCVIIPRTSEAAPPFEPVPFIPCYVSLLPSGTTEVTAVLYKGSCKIEEGASGDQLNTVPVATTFAVTSGSAELVTGGVIITGDCTITIS